MDAILEGFPGSMNGFIFNRGSVPLRLNENLANGFKVSHGFVDPPFLSTDPRHHPSDSGPSSGTSSEGDSPDSGDFSNVFFKYLNEMLMEEDLETKPCMLQNCLALQAAEKSFYEVLVQESPPSSNQSPPGFEQRPDDSFAGGSSVDISNSHAADNSVESKCVCDLGESESSYVQSHRPVSFGEIEPIRTAKGGRTINYLPNGNRETSDLESTRSAPAEQTRDVAAMAEKNRRNTSPNGSREKKNHHREDSQDYLEEGRSSKHSAVYAGDSESLEMYDEVLLCRGVGNESSSCGLPESTGNGGSRRFQHGGNRSSGENNSKTTRLKKQGNKGDVVDLWTLLTQCAHTVASGDQRTANELLKQIRQHSSPFGDGTQRLSHYFANALEVRLAGTRTPVYTPLVSNGTSAADILKAYRVYVTACPFKRMSNFFANRTIRKLVLSQKATRVHIIDFGILYGFQWPCLIQRLSERPGGPPKLRITGIELPQPGFRPAERVEETGRRLENYCKRFNVPFEYSVIAQKWETIQLEDLKIDRDELVIVNCLYRLRNLPDETLAINSPRDTVLKLIKRINPDLFVHGVVNGTYNAPFFATRFREALFHFSAFFDMFDANVAREDEQRFMFEKEIFGRDAMNVIACEGLERVERPEPYKQWQVRNLRAGLRQLPLDQDVLQRVKRQESSSADELFSDGKMIPTEIKKKGNAPSKQMDQYCGSHPPMLPPRAMRGSSAVSGESSKQESTKESKTTINEADEKQNSKSFWRFKRSSSCGSGYGRSLCPLPALLSRSNSTGSAANLKRAPFSNDGQNSKQSSQKHLSTKASRSSVSTSYPKPPLKKGHGAYGNGVGINPILNVPSTNLFGLGSIFSNGKDKNKK